MGKLANLDFRIVFSKNPLFAIGGRRNWWSILAQKIWIFAIWVGNVAFWALLEAGFLRFLKVFVLEKWLRVVGSTSYCIDLLYSWLLSIASVLGWSDNSNSQILLFVSDFFHTFSRNIWKSESFSWFFLYHRATWASHNFASRGRMVSKPVI